MSERVVLLGVDGLDWGRLRAGIAAGRLPSFAHLLAEGAHADVAVAPCIPGLAGAEAGMNSPTLWTTVATGQYYFQHGVYDFCNLLDSVENPPIFESRHVLSPRVWDVLSEHDLASVVVGCYVSHPAYQIKGVMVSDLFGEVAGHNVVWPRERCDELARLLGAADYDGYVATSGALGTEAGVRQTRESCPAREALAAAVRSILTRFTRLGAAGVEQMLGAPTDSRLRKLIEYRLIYPRVRDERVHRLFLSLIDGEPWQFATVYYRLIDFVSHGFWTVGHRLPEDFVRIYGAVVDEAYVWIDQCLGEVRQRLTADDRLLVLSDHGFTATAETDDLARCEEVSEFTYGCHAEPAALLVGGGAARGEVAEVSLLDIAPSILDFFGIAQAETLDGGPIPGLLHPDAPRQLPPRAAYRYVRPVEAGAVSEIEQRQVLERLAALGYLDG